MKKQVPSNSKSRPLTENYLATADIPCHMPEGSADNGLPHPAATFLRENGHNSLVSLGCGHELNRVDNHLRLMIGLNLKYYVGIDLQPQIKPACTDLFIDSDDAIAMLTRYYQGRPDRFWKMVRLYPGTLVEELTGVPCAAVVCQRVLPFCRWEEVIISMSPKLVLQEDLHGCERQQLRGTQYVRTLSNIRRFGLRPFRPWSIFPGEKNLVLWRRRDLEEEFASNGKFKWLRRLGQAFIG